MRPEEVWLADTGPDPAFYHQERANRTGAVRQFQKGLAALLLLACGVRAQAPVKIGFACVTDVFQELGIGCTPDEPCDVYLELTSAASAGARIVVSGNLHTTDLTLSSIVLASGDGGATWNEPYQRIRAAGLDQIQFIDPENGWISGEMLQGRPHDPFLLVTHDAGKTWQSEPVFEQSTLGLIDQFRFDSKDTGRLVIDRTQPDENGIRYGLYQTHTGGGSWSPVEEGPAPIKLPRGIPAIDWRLRPDAKTQTYRLDRREAERWAAVAAFPIHLAECRELNAGPQKP
jgi:hypothetical protein